MAQMLRYWSYPAGIAAYANDCQLPEDGARFVYGLDGDLEEIHYSMKTEKLSTTAGEYDWETMMLRPLQFSLSTGWTGEPATPEACEAIGKLMYDCGVAVKMSYNFSENGGSGSYARDMDDAFKKYFGYASAAYYGGSAALTEDPETRAHAILSNLDARCPVLLAITGEMGGHAIVADGYGFSGEEKTTYVHLNMGWGGQNDVWYNLPQINVSSNPENFSGFDTLQELIYNLFPTNNGEVVSGRVTD
jgi:hypothetical protein